MSLAKRLQSIQGRIGAACETVGRDPAEVTLIAVSKTVSTDNIREVYDLGIRDIGESRLQEALPKLQALPPDIRWHYIGPLQSNKATKVAERFSAIHSLENVRQLDALRKAHRKIDALIEINIGSEPQKKGVLPQDLDEFIESVLYCPQVRLRGLMTVGPMVQNAEEMRPYFRQLKDLLERVPGGTWLSMGMSGDFEVAIQEGSTHVRVGSALFGERA